MSTSRTTMFAVMPFDGSVKIYKRLPNIFALALVITEIKILFFFTWSFTTIYWLFIGYLFIYLLVIYLFI